MKKAYILLFIILFVSGISAAQESDISDEENFIYWSEDHKLAWTDFDGFFQKDSEHAAFSIIGYISQFERDENRIWAEITTYFDKNESWTKHWIQLILEHEQGHFDLAELNARKYRKRLKATMEKKDIDVSDFEEMNDVALQELREWQKKYDEETNYSMDYEAQQQWLAYIAEELEKLSDYADPEIIVSRNKK